MRLDSIWALDCTRLYSVMVNWLIFYLGLIGGVYVVTSTVHYFSSTHVVVHLCQASMIMCGVRYRHLMQEF